MLKLRSIAQALGCFLTLLAFPFPSFTQTFYPAGCYSASSFYTQLKGTYAFLLHGFSGTVPTTTLGSFTTLTPGPYYGTTPIQGSLEMNTGDGGLTIRTFSGFYVAAFDGTIVISISAAGDPVLDLDYNACAGAQNAQGIVTALSTVATTNGVSEYGSFYLQDSAVAQRSGFLPGSFIFGLSGGTFADRVLEAGRFDATASGSITHGELDTFSEQGSAPVNSLAAFPFAGSYNTALSSYGISSVFLQTSAGPRQFDLLPVSDDRLLVLSTDPGVTGLPVVSGTALRQVPSVSSALPYGLKNSTLSGPSVYTLNGLNGGDGFLARVGIANFNGNYSVRLSGLQQVNAQVSPIPPTSESYSVADNGRTVIGDPSAPLAVGYINAAGSGYFLTPDPSPSAIFLEPQTAKNLSTTSLMSGDYAFNNPVVQSPTEPQSIGKISIDGNGNITQFSEVDNTYNGIYVPNAGQFYNIDSTGLITSSITGFLGYVVSPTRFILLQTSSGFTQLGEPLEFNQAPVHTTYPETLR